MRCPELKDLPLPSSQQKGWPWTQESPQLPDKIQQGFSWPKLSIVTPTLNQGQFFEQSIRSVLLQGYPNLEYFIIDGGSTDETIDIIEKYEKWITYWISEKDQGQTQAINKGFKETSGEIVAWLNSDDFYTAEALSIVGSAFLNLSDVDLIYGDMLEIYEDRGVIKMIKGREFCRVDLIRFKFIMQPTCFWRRTLFDKIGYLDESYHYVFDLEYWIRAGLSMSIKYLPETLAFFRVHSKAKTQQNNTNSTMEGIRLFGKLFSNPRLPPDIKNLKGRVLQHWYERLGFQYIDYGDFRKARMPFLKAVFFAPVRFRNFILLAYIFDSFLNIQLGKKFHQFGKHLKSMSKKL